MVQQEILIRLPMCATPGAGLLATSPLPKAGACIQSATGRRPSSGSASTGGSGSNRIQMIGALSRVLGSFQKLSGGPIGPIGLI